MSSGRSCGRATTGAAGLALLTVLAGCGGGDAPDDVAPASFAGPRIERLRPVEWESGVPAAIEAGRDVERASLDPASEVGAWTTQRGEVAAEDGLLRVRSTAADRSRPVRLDRAGLDLALEGVDRFRVALELTGASPVRCVLDLRTPRGPREKVVEAEFGSSGAHVLESSLNGSGVLEGLTFLLPDGAALGTIRFSAQSIVPGASPEVIAGQARDAGMRTLNQLGGPPLETLNESRRAIPSRSGVWQVATYEGGGRPRLKGSIALPDEPRLHIGPVRFEIHAVLSGSNPPEADAAPLWSMELTSETDANRWVPFSVDLPGAAGEERELFLTTRSAAAAGRVDGYFGAPLIVRLDAPRPPDVILITGDTLRRDHVGAIREALGLPPLAGLQTPFFDALAAGGTTFVDALSTSNATSPSHASILTGHYVRDHRVTDNRRVLSEGALTLAELLRERYFCVSSVTAGHLNAPVSGLGQGFDVAYGVPPVPGRGAAGANIADPNDFPDEFDDVQSLREAPFANARLAPLLDEAEELPLFLWLHYFDPHTPYRVTTRVAGLLPENASVGTPIVDELARRTLEVEGDARTLEEVRSQLVAETPMFQVIGDRTIEWTRALYAAGISELDMDLSRLFERLEARGGDPLIAFTADHGESLGERDIWFAHAGAYTNTLNVPLVLNGPGVEAGLVSTAPASTIDLLPTLLDLVGIDAPDGLPGRSLVGTAPEADRRRWFQHSSDLEFGYREGARHVVFTSRRHPRGAPTQWRDAGDVEALEAGEAVAIDDAERERLANEIMAWAKNPVLDLEAIEASLDEAQQAELRALGYADE